uniref:cytochrome-c oxidase n=1 Tax=Tamerlania zarudnyi TaxID=138578 RepID=A0A894JL85_9TREM|nr:cytochrome c oxidase subunit II [Tamerlania zarudnyi]QRV61248.1 cytochrome c oxidase subunit II [Tamerlania zarudnyi]
MFFFGGGSGAYLNLVVYALFISLFISVWVFCVMMWQLLFSFNVSLVGSENDLLELIWTVVPSFVIGVSSFLNLSCLVDVPMHWVDSVIKVIGRQWYWTYEVPGEEGAYDSMMLDFINAVDKPLRVPVGIPHSLIVTSSDVIHSFSLPAFHLKLDAIPGRINHTVFLPDRLGVFVGYCSELCGAGHSYMPIVVEVVKVG